MSLIAELKRRNVFRVAAAYAVVAWLLIQVGDVAADSLGFPDWFMPMLFVVLGLGFPVAIVLSWAFETSPEGIKRTERGDSEPGKAAFGLADGLLIALLVVVVAAIVYQAMPGARTPDDGDGLAAASTETTPAGVTETTAEASIAVLPFIDLSAEGDQAYFSEGIAEEILNVLASIDGLRVASRTSSFMFKNENKSILVIAETLGVAHVLEGSVRKAGDRVRVTAQLIGAGSDAHLWSETYDRELSAENLFSIQDDIANAIVAALDETMGLSREAGIRVAATTGSLDAYELYLQARQMLSVMSPANVRWRVDLLQQAVALDPEYAEAWGELALETAYLPTWDHSLAVAPYQHQGLEAARRSLALDPENTSAWHATLTAYRYLDQWEEFSDALESARKQMPDFDADPQLWLGLGYLERARIAARRKQAEDPDQTHFWVLVEGLALEALGEGEQALKKLESAVLNGYQGSAESTMADIYRRIGETPAANALLSRELAGRDAGLVPLLPYLHELMSGNPAPGSADARRFIALARELGFDVEDLVRPSSTYGLRVPDDVAVALGHADAVAGTYFAESGSDEAGGNSPRFWMWNSTLKHFRQSEAFKQRVRDTGMLAYWREHGWPDLCRPIVATSGNDDFECD